MSALRYMQCAVFVPASALTYYLHALNKLELNVKVCKIVDGSLGPSHL